MAAALRLARAGGRVDLLGCSGVLPQLDLTPLWAHELQVQGFCGYGIEAAAGGEHTIALALRLLTARPDVPLKSLVTTAFRWAVTARPSKRPSSIGGAVR